MSPQVAAILMIKNEVDVIDLWLETHLSKFDMIAVYDSSTDGTLEVLQRHPSLLLWHDLLPYAGRRRNLPLALLEHHEFDGWVFQMDADNFLLEEDPREIAARAESEGVKVVGAKVAQFYMTDVDWDDRDSPLFERRQYHFVNWNITLAWRFTPYIKWRGVLQECCIRRQKGEPSLRRSPILHHYQWRTPEQTQKKLDMHFTEPVYKHLYSPNWWDYVYDHKKLRHIDDGFAGGPRLRAMQKFVVEVPHA